MSNQKLVIANLRDLVDQYTVFHTCRMAGVMCSVYFKNGRLVSRYLCLNAERVGGEGFRGWMENQLRQFGINTNGLGFKYVCLPWGLREQLMPESGPYYDSWGRLKFLQLLLQKAESSLGTQFKPLEIPDITKKG